MAPPSLYITNARTGLRHIISSLGLRYLEALPAGSNPSPHGAILVSIDFEGGTIATNAATDDIDDINIEFGVAILDPLDLETGPSTGDENRIKSFNFVSGSPAYEKRAHARFQFGQTTTCPPSKFIDTLFALLPPERPILLIANSVYAERATLKSLGFHMDHPRLRGVVDIWPMSGDVYHTPRGLGSLARIMQELQVSWRRGFLHCAGNDAYHTMQCALLLAERGYREQCPDPETKDLNILGALRQAATVNIPTPCRPYYPSEKDRERLHARPESRRKRDSFRAECCRCREEMEEEGIASFFRLESGH